LKEQIDADNKPLDLVHKQAAEQYGYPLSLYTYDPGLRDKLNNILYLAENKNEAGIQTLTFDYIDASTTVRKVFRFDDTYVVHIDTHVTQDGNVVSSYPSWPAALGDQHQPYSYASSRIDIAHDDTVDRKPPVSGFFLTGRTFISNGNTINGPFFWGGVVDQYFEAIFLPDDPTNAALIQFHNLIPRDPNELDPDKKRSQTYAVLGAAVGSSKGTTSLRLFAGPKDLHTLQSVRGLVPGEAPSVHPTGPDLEGSVEFGTFGFIAKPLFLGLRFIHDHIAANWGWSIVIMTILINLVLFPLRWTSMKSGLMMQKVQPEMNAINERVKGLPLTDPRRQEATMKIQELYKREGINPLAGCLPILLQMPFLYAFYAMISTTMELLNARWLWIHDLSSPDPIHLLPVMLVVSMFVMQRITPTPGMDPVQARMMQVMMPLMLGGITWALPAGLGVYWVASNLMGYVLQLYVNNTKFAKEIRTQIANRQVKRKK
jgi:YidC/Oxa1 family membrane protein insertase